MFHFIVNSKNYVEAAGSNAARLAEAMTKVSGTHLGSSVEFYLAVPAFYISELSERFPKIHLLAQHLDLSESGSTTGYLVPEIAKLAGARGTLVNHSEHGIPAGQIKDTVHVLRKLEMISVVCARDAQEVGAFTSFDPDFIAIEPPELIGSGRAVSKMRPELISDSKTSLVRAKKISQNTALLCGAGIIEGEDVRRSVELGSEGILVASGVVKAPDWVGKITDLARGFEQK